MKKGDTVLLISKPNGYTSQHYSLTVGNTYKIVDFMGSNIVTTTDVEAETASYSRDRVKEIANGD